MISNHSYVITGVEEVQYLESTAKLIRVRNPWGDTEWEGAWSDGWVSVELNYNSLIGKELSITYITCTILHELSFSINSYELSMERYLSESQ